MTDDAGEGDRRYDKNKEEDNKITIIKRNLVLSICCIQVGAIPFATFQQSIDQILRNTTNKDSNTSIGV